MVEYRPFVLSPVEALLSTFDTVSGTDWSDGMMRLPNIPVLHYSTTPFTVGLCQPPGGKTL